MPASGKASALACTHCRTDSAAKISDICEQAHGSSSVRALFEGFRSQAENALLFLKSVTKLSVHVKAADSQSPELLFEASASTQVPLSPSVLMK